MPISGCHDLPLATFNLPSRVFRHGCRRAECLERRWGGFFHTHSGGMRRLAAEIPDIFIPLSRNDVRNDGAFFTRRFWFTIGFVMDETMPVHFRKNRA